MIVIQLVTLTHICWFVHRLIHDPVGTTVHIQFNTTAVHIVAHHVPYVRVTTDQSTSHVPPIQGYCVLNIVHDVGWVIVGINQIRAKLFLVTQLNVVSAHQTNTFPSGCIRRSFIVLFAKVQVNLSSNIQVLVKRAI